MPAPFGPITLSHSPAPHLNETSDNTGFDDSETEMPSHKMTVSLAMFGGEASEWGDFGGEGEGEVGRESEEERWEERIEAREEGRGKRGIGNKAEADASV